jgi:hypothetical protein
MAPALHIYLQDHLAGATFGLELVQRCRRKSEGPGFAESLEELTTEIAADRETLRQVMRDLGADASRTKMASDGLWRRFDDSSRMAPSLSTRRSHASWSSRAWRSALRARERCG